MLEYLAKNIKIKVSDISCPPNITMPVMDDGGIGQHNGGNVIQPKSLLLS